MNKDTHYAYMKCYLKKYRAEHGPSIKEYLRKYHEKYPLASIEAARKRLYGISMKHFQGMLDIAKGECQICHKPFYENKGITHTACVDHSHNDGKVRGLLCSKCNFGLGSFRDSVKLLQDAAKYLRERKGKSCIEGSWRISTVICRSRKTGTKKYLAWVNKNQYQEALEVHKGRCAICGAHNEKSSRRLCVDHDHSLATFRGLLCNRCNSGLGGFRDSPRLLDAAARYLRRYDVRSLKE